MELGMTYEEVEKYINKIAFSGAEEFVEKYNLVGNVNHQLMKKILLELDEWENLIKDSLDLALICYQENL
jgi:hypothetical protein